MLNRMHLIFTVACLSASAGLMLPSATWAQQQTTVTHSSSVTVSSDASATLPPGITQKDLNSDKAIEKAFKAVTEDSLNKTGFDNLVSRFVDQDRDRISKSVSSGSLNNINGSKNQKLTDLIADIEGTWKSKYGHAFDIDVTKAYPKDFVQIQTGEVQDANLLVGKWPVDPSLTSAISPDNAGGKLSQSDADRTKGKMFGGDVNLEKGRNVAVAHFPSSHGMNGLNASLIHEAGGWKFDVPNTLTAQKLYDNLVSNLTMLDQQKSNLPADEQDAYRQYTHAVMAAIYDVPLQGTQGTAELNQGVRPLNNSVNNK